jgi:dTDP-4-amino-4,6-dideoxygalactose transaminase
VSCHTIPPMPIPLFDTATPLDPLRAALTPRTKAVIAVDLFGNPAPVSEIREQTGLAVIEDAAQAAGASVAGRRAGSLGTAATFSFFPSKNLGCFGDGGAMPAVERGVAVGASVSGR